MKQDKLVVKNNCHNGCCSCCGDCCIEFIPWTEKEIEIVKAYLKEHPEITEQNKVHDSNINVKCAFNDEKTHRCLIYPVRPSICKCFKCNQDPKDISKNRGVYLRSAYVNKNCSTNPFMSMSNLVSTHSMFFNNTLWDYDFVIAYSRKFASLFNIDSKVLCEQLIKYFVTLIEE